MSRTSLKTLSSVKEEWLDYSNLDPFYHSRGNEFSGVSYSFPRPQHRILCDALNLAHSICGLVASVPPAHLLCAKQKLDLISIFLQSQHESQKTVIKNSWGLKRTSSGPPYILVKKWDIALLHIWFVSIDRTRIEKRRQFLHKCENSEEFCVFWAFYFGVRQKTNPLEYFYLMQRTSQSFGLHRSKNTTVYTKASDIAINLQVIENVKVGYARTFVCLFTRKQSIRGFVTKKCCEEAVCLSRIGWEPVYR